MGLLLVIKSLNLTLTFSRSKIWWLLNLDLQWLYDISAVSLLWSGSCRWVVKWKSFWYLLSIFHFSLLIHLMTIMCYLLISRVDVSNSSVLLAPSCVWIHDLAGFCRKSEEQKALSEKIKYFMLIMSNFLVPNCGIFYLQDSRSYAMFWAS